MLSSGFRLASAWLLSGTTASTEVCTGPECADDGSDGVGLLQHTRVQASEGLRSALSPGTRNWWSSAANAAKEEEEEEEIDEAADQPEEEDPETVRGLFRPRHFGWFHRRRREKSSSDGLTGTKVFTKFYESQQKVYAEPENAFKDWQKHLLQQDKIGQAAFIGLKTVMSDFEPWGPKAYEMYDSEWNYGFSLPVRVAFPLKSTERGSKDAPALFVPLISSMPLTAEPCSASQQVTRAVIMLQDAAPNSARTPFEDFFGFWSEQVWGASANPHVLVIRPWLLTDDGHPDALSGADWDPSAKLPEGATVARWTTGEHLTTGGDSVAGSVSALDVLDQILEKLQESRRTFPHLHVVTVFGMSGGGTLASAWALLSRYACAGCGRASVQVVSASQDAWAFLDSRRPSLACLPAKSHALLTGSTTAPRLLAGRDCGFGEVDSVGGCQDYDRWPYGFSEAPANHSYIMQFVGPGNALLQKRVHEFPRRKVLFMVGSLDDCNCNQPAFEGGAFPKKSFANGASCFRPNGNCADTWTASSWTEASARAGGHCAKSFQGWTRLQRLHNYASHLETFFKERNVDYHPDYELFAGRHTLRAFLQHPAFSAVAFGTTPDMRG